MAAGTPAFLGADIFTGQAAAVLSVFPQTCQKKLRANDSMICSRVYSSAFSVLGEWCKSRWSGVVKGETGVVMLQAFQPFPFEYLRLFVVYKAQRDDVAAVNA